MSICTWWCTFSAGGAKAVFFIVWHWCKVHLSGAEPVSSWCSLHARRTALPPPPAPIMSPERSSNSNIAESLSWWGTNWRDWFDKTSEQKVNTFIYKETTITTSDSGSWSRPALGWLSVSGLPQWLVWWLKVTEKIVTVKALKLTKAYVRWCKICYFYREKRC